jgi:hypothetical protein
MARANLAGIIGKQVETVPVPDTKVPPKPSASPAPAKRATNPDVPTPTLNM